MQLHHIGFVVKDIEKYASQMMTGALLAETEDPVQQARLALYEGFSDVRVELVQPLTATSFTHNFLQKQGEGFHHLCYEATQDEMLKSSVEKRLIKLLGPVPATLFGGRDVIFYVNRNLQVIEFLLK